ncbi:MAG: hypothetical protein ACXVB4_19015, partial [Pseudobdellovibrionaceae bacterium]
SDTPKRATRLSQLPQEISALRTFLASAPDMKQQVLRTMMDKSIEKATLSAQVATDNDVVSATMGDAGLMASGMEDFGSRIQTSAKTGISMLNQMLDSISANTQCLVGNQQQAFGSILSASVQMASSFASSGQDLTGSQLAMTVSKLTTFVREQGFATIFQMLNKQEFLTSMACLMEVTSESYCQARFGMQLFQKGMTDLKVSQNNKIDVSSGNPFAGYYVLNTHVPNITKWLQKIQIGVDPKLPTDATFQNNILQELTDFNKGVKTLIADYNSDLSTIKNSSSQNTRKNALMKLIFKITDSMGGNMNGFSSQGSERKNFFTISRNALNIPFDLVGLPVPDQVAGRVMPMMTYDQWFQANMDILPIFNDPLALAETVGHNMQNIIKAANIAAIEYFNKWYIVDMAALVNESTIDINYTVQDSLIAVNKYLEAEKGRIQKYGGNVSIIPTIVDTQIRINNILKVYSELEDIGRKIQADKVGSLNQSDAETQAVTDAYKKLVNTVYEQFNVMLSRSGFVANRMVNFVYEDYILLLKNKVDFTQYQDDLSTATGMAALDKMMQMYNGNPANIQTDLNMALRVHKGNIDALNLLLRDSIIQALTDLDAIKNGDKPSSWSPVKRLVKDSIMDTMSEKSWLEKILPGSFFKSPWLSASTMPFKFTPWLPANMMSYYAKHKASYSNDSMVNSPQSEFQDAENVKAQLCIQALAFYDQKTLRNLCQGAVLKSPFGAEMSSLNMSYDQKLVEHFNDPNTSVQMRTSLNHSERICAFRDYNMRNMAFYMSLGKDAAK